MVGLVAGVSWSEPFNDSDRLEPLLATLSYYGGQSAVRSIGRHAIFGAVSRLPIAPADLAPTPSCQAGCLASIRFDCRDEFEEQLTGKKGGEWSDEQLLMLGHAHWGEQLGTYLDGDFAVIIWDGRKRELTALRDPFGARPLYYRECDGRLWLATEVETLLLTAPGQERLNDDAVRELLANEHERPSDTLFRDIFRVRPGHCLTATREAIRERRYWQPRRSFDASKTSRQLADNFRALFEKSVAARLAGDRPIVAQLSGGLDSSSIVCMADSILGRNGQSHRLYAASALYPGLACDESRYINQVSRFIAAPTVCWNGLTARSIDLNETPALAHPWLGQSSATMAGDHRLALQLKASAILSGFGGDELLFEHGVFRDLAANGEWGQLLAQTLLSRVYSSHDRLHLLLDAVRGALPAWLRRELRRWKPRPQHRAATLNSTPAPDAPACSPERQDRSAALRHSHTRQMTWKWLTHPRLWWSVELQVHAAARNGLEARFPFLDRRLADFVLGLPYTARLPRGQMKHILRTSMRGLVPSAVLKRTQVTTFESVVRQNFVANAPQIEAVLYGNSWLADRFVNQRHIQTAFEKTRRAAAQSLAESRQICAILDVAQLELWLRGLHNRRVL